MNGIDFCADPSLRQILFNSNLLNIIPSGISIATDTSCKTIIHNPIAANFLRVGLSGLQPLVYCNGKLLAEEEMPISRATQFGEEVIGQELVFDWDDGDSRIAKWSASPLRNENGAICGAIATMEDITKIVHMGRELENLKIKNGEFVEERDLIIMQELITREHAEKEARLEERFHASIDTMLNDLEINTSVRDQDGKIVDFMIDYINDASVANTKMTKEQQIGHRLLDIMPEQIEFGLFEAYCKVVETGEPLAMEVVVKHEFDRYIIGAYHPQIRRQPIAQLHADCPVP